jgi:hypothetical protein
MNQYRPLRPPQVGTTVDASVACVVTSQHELARELESGRLYKARRMLIPVVRTT